MNLKRRTFLKRSLATVAIAAVPGMLNAQQRNLLTDFDEKYGTIKIYDNVPVKVGNRIVEWYVPYIYTYSRVTLDGMFRPLLRINQVFENDLQNARKSVPPEIWDSFIDSKNARDFGDRNRRDVRRETGRIRVPSSSPRDYPGQINKECASVVINSLFDENGNKIPGYENYPYAVGINRDRELTHFQGMEDVVREYRIKFDTLKRMLPEVKAYANKNNADVLYFIRGLNPFDLKRYDTRTARMLMYVLLQDKTTGICKVLNGHIPQKAINLDGSPVLDAFGRQTDIQGHQKAKFHDDKYIDELIDLMKKIQEGPQSPQTKALVVVPNTEFVIKSPKDLRLRGVTTKNQKAPFDCGIRD